MNVTEMIEDFLSESDVLAEGRGPAWGKYGGPPGTRGGEYWARRAKDSKHVKIPDREAQKLLTMKKGDPNPAKWLALFWVPKEYVDHGEQKFRIRNDHIKPIWTWDQGDISNRKWRLSESVLLERSPGALVGSVDLSKAEVLKPGDIFDRTMQQKVTKAQAWTRYHIEMKGGAEIALFPSKGKPGRYRAVVSIPGARGKDLTFMDKTPKELRKIFQDNAVKAKMNLG